MSENVNVDKPLSLTLSLEYLPDDSKSITECFGVDNEKFQQLWNVVVEQNENQVGLGFTMKFIQENPMLLDSQKLLLIMQTCMELTRIMIMANARKQMQSDEFSKLSETPEFFRQVD